MAAKDPIFVWSSSSSDGNPESPTFYLLSNPSDYFRDDNLDNFFQNDAGHDHKHGLLTACSDQWTRNDNKLFESAIAELGSDTPNLFAAIAAKVPGKTVEEIEKHYLLLVEDLETIESGCFPVPQYADDDDDDDDESVMKNGTDNADDDEGRRDDGEDSKRKNKKRRRGKVPGEFRRRGTPWTDEEHSLFLAGLGKYGRGDWRSISRNYVITKTPTQVASHAQKYFLRMETNAANSDKRRRPSRLDQTLPNLPNHGNGMAMMDHLQNLTTAQNNNYRPIMPAPSPLVPQVPPPIYTSFTSNYDFVGANNRAIQNQYGGAISSSLPLPRMPAAYPTVPVTTMNLPSSSSLYDYNFSYGASSSMKHGPSQAGPSQILEELPMNYYQPTNSTYSFPQFPNYPM